MTRETVNVTRDELATLIRGKKDGFFCVDFIKRTTGTQRRMICRNSVRKHLRDDAAPRNMNPALHNLITTYSMDSRDYRNISIEGLIGANIDGKRYEVAE